MYRHPGGDCPGGVRTDERLPARGAQRRHPPAGDTRPADTGGTVPRIPRHPLQRTDDVGVARGVCPARREEPLPAQAGDGTAQSLGTCLRPHPEGGTHHCRPGGGVRHRGPAHRRGHQLPQPRPWHLGNRALMH